MILLTCFVMKSVSRGFCSHDFAHRNARKRRILKPNELAKVFTPKKIPRGVTSNGKYCYYYEDLRSGDKDREIGDCFGTVEDDALKKWRVKFHDGVEEHMGPRQMAMSLQPGQEIIMDGHRYKCTKYTKKGCHLNLLEKNVVRDRGSGRGGGGSGERRWQGQGRRWQGRQR